MTREELGEIAAKNDMTFEEAVGAILANIKEPFVVACFDIIKAQKKMREALQE